MKSLLLVTGLAGLLATDARANQTFDFTFNGSNTFSAGQLITTDVAGGAYKIIGITGTIDGFGIAGVAPAGTFFNPNFATDNLLYASGALVDTGGFIIEPEQPIGIGAAHVPEQIQQTPFEASATPGVFLYDAAVSNSAADDRFGSLTVTHVASAVPEPATLALLGVGLLALGATRGRVG